MLFQDYTIQRTVLELYYIYIYIYIYIQTQCQTNIISKFKIFLNSQD